MSKPPSISGRDSGIPKIDGESSSEAEKPVEPEQKTRPTQNPSGVLANLRPASKRPLGGAAPSSSKRVRKALVQGGDLGGASLSADPAPLSGEPPAATEESARGDDIHGTVKTAVRAFLRQALKDARPDNLDERLLGFVSVDEYRDLADAAIDTGDEAKRGARLSRLGARLADLTEPQRERFVGAVINLKDESVRAMALAPLGVAMESMSDAQQGRVVDSAIGIRHEREGALALAGLGAGIAHLSEPRRKRLVEAAAAIKDERYRALAMAGVGAGMAGMTSLSESGGRDGTP